MTMPPWARGPFELLLHAEGHLRAGNDFDRRIALISFDNAVEVAITTYLTLHPIQRGGKAYKREDVDKWLKNYHSKLEFLDDELAQRGATWQTPKAHIIWAHDHRNEQYHGGSKGTPERLVLDEIRKAAIWIFGFLFDVTDAEKAVEEENKQISPPKPEPRRDYDTAIDNKHGIINIGEYPYYASEVLFQVDTDVYNELGSKLCAERDSGEGDE